MSAARRVANLAVTMAATAVLGACTPLAIESNLAATSQFAESQAGVGTSLHASDGERGAAEARARELLAAPLSAAGAVEIALRFSPGFQRLLADSAAASAAATQSARLPNPAFSYGRIAAGGILEIDRAVSASLLDLVLWPRRRGLAELQQVQHRLRSAGDVISTVADVRQAWVDAVAAAQSAVYAEQVRSAVAASAELASRMTKAGNLPRLERARQQAFYADVSSEVVRAQLDAVARRESLIRLLGLSGELATMLKLPERLPELPASIDPESIVAKRAFAERLDVQLAKAELEFTARSLGLTRATATVNALDVSAISNSTPDQPTLTGFGIEWRLPLFDFGDARRANARAIYLAAISRTSQVAADAYSHVRESYDAYRKTFDIARLYRDEVVPLRKSITDEDVLRYNGMLVSVFELLADAREQVASVRQAIAADRDFWKADAALRAAVIGQPVEALALGSPIVAPGSGAAQPH